MKITAERCDEIRTAIKSANRVFSNKLICEVMRRAGLELKISPSALDKFVRGETHALRHEKDVRHLERFFFSMDIGRSICERPGTSTSTFDRLIAGLKIRLPSERAKRVNGKYFCFHGSVTQKSHYTVRFIEVRRKRNAIVEVRSKLVSNKHSDVEEIYESEGFLNFDKEDFQILMLNINNDNSNNDLIGLNLIIFDTDQVKPRNGPVDSGYAYMLALSEFGDVTTRRLRLSRIKRSISDREIIKLTGEYSKENIPKEFLKEFDELHNSFPEEKLTDPIFDW